MLAAAPDIRIRPVGPDDDLARLTQMIHAAYAHHAASGLRFWGTHQSVEDAAERLASGTAWVMLDGAAHIGTATLCAHRPESSVEFYRRPGVGVLSQFCIRPDRQGTGLGRRLHAHVLQHAAALNLAGIALDTAGRPIV